jgi:hypothetical protein
VGAPPEPLVGELGKPALDEIYPRAVGGGEVDVKPGMAEQPSMDLGGLVSRDVVDDQMDGELLGNASIDEIQEATELDGAMAFCHVGDDVT